MLVVALVWGSVLGGVSGVVLGAAPASAAAGIEDYASWQPQKRCAERVKPGTRALARWTVRRGGSLGGMLRACSSGGASEHKDGRAFDWMLDASRRRDSRIVRRYLRALFAADRAGRPDARARRMGIMYVIWDDRIYSAWNRFESERYLSSSGRSRRRCSRTLRHRDHVHVSLGFPGARARTSWYDGRVS